MGHMALLESSRMRGSSSSACPRIKNARTYFNFNRTRVLARQHAVQMPLGRSSTKGYLQNAESKDYGFFLKLIGREFALAILDCDELKVTIKGKNHRHFDFNAGTTREGKKVALLKVY